METRAARQHSEPCCLSALSGAVAISAHAAGHAFVQNLRRGHHDIATDTPDCHRLHIAFDDLALTF